MMIAELPKSIGFTFSGLYRVSRVRRCTATNGTPFVALSLEDLSGELKAYAWLDRYQGDQRIAEFDRVRVKGRLRFMDGEWRTDLLEGYTVQDVTKNPVRLLPKRLCKIPEALQSLHDSIDQLTNEPLRKFVFRVLSSDDIALPFIAVPASMRHHHSHVGGLLEHTLECMQIVRALTETDRDIQELGVVAALFHDIGKIRIFTQWGRHTQAGHVLHHDALTMEILAPFLSQLDREWQDGAVALRYLWSWRQTANFRARPLMAVADAVTLADRMSSARNAELLAFKDQPEWKRFAKISDDTCYWRPRPFPGEMEGPPSDLKIEATR
jgi:3'-5' exoribonuclease